MAAADIISVEVAYAESNRQTLIALTVPANCTVEQAIQLSGILQQHPDINLHCQSVGIYGQIRALQDSVNNEDRIEIYRPLIQDPKSARRGRVNG